ncbi:MAG TPA: hypothetical protein VER32_14955 [Pyrinomonadaceae bacterium]|nr:hypothetical protein [Pyrinomonadaceae bacterium]
MSTAPLDASRRPHKSRIVVDLDKLEEERRSRGGAGGRGPSPRGRGAKVLLIVGLAAVALVVVALVAALLWWRSFQGSPAYSLALLVDAAHRDDVRGVESLIDTDQIVTGLVPQVTEKLTGGVPLPEATRRQMDAGLQNLLPRVRETLRDEVKEGVKAVGEQAGDTPFPLLALGVRRASEVTESGDTASVKFTRGEQPVELEMKRDGARWKVTSLRDDALASRIAERVRAALPAAAPQQQPTTRQPPARRRPAR